MQCLRRAMPQCPSPGTPHEQQRTAVEKQLRKAGGVTAVAALLEEYYRLSGSALSSDAQGLASFDGYFYINLADRHDRRAQIESMLQAYGIPQSRWTRVNAVAQPKNGHLGCVQSHIRALELAKARGLRNAMILEDDFTFTKPKAEVDATLRRTLDVLGTDWDVLQIGLVPVDVDQAP
eukprot:CAMPEP_0174370180 /NCGR_PEP_ID=MMETSP0811_2-20130205/95224_1 /TAXON_ID=73025 ORGANISM="Eutreptiella gymnastica-like, Strain CCMP1594" /NCGR_SAMPLE_ID=MMETSP0811_2 /ASSEMBLY_ACC=CAM_ASM_000667 /LENGTH=177 /DNA_ID=CAMNT_0015515339 /DNA_START=43 /DNA_END=573 /DNA_ORIENTATION=-